MPPSRLRRIAPILGVPLALAACNGDPTPSAAQFCAEISTNRDEIVTPTFLAEVDIDAHVELHQRLESLAPLAVAEEWAIVTDAVETAATVVPTDSNSVQRAVDAAYRSEAAAVAVSEWVLASCGVDLGPVSTIAPHDRPEPAAPVGSDS